jgi:hypothetical protein
MGLFRPHAWRSACWGGRQGRRQRRHTLPLFQSWAAVCRAHRWCCLVRCLVLLATAALLSLLRLAGGAHARPPKTSRPASQRLAAAIQHSWPPTPLQLCAACSAARAPPRERGAASNTGGRPISARRAGSARGPLNERFQRFSGFERAQSGKAAPLGGGTPFTHQRPHQWQPFPPTAGEVHRDRSCRLLFQCGVQGEPAATRAASRGAIRAAARRRRVGRD